MVERARGRRRPDNPREEFYRRLLDAGLNPDPAQFVLPRALWVLETTPERASDAKACGSRTGVRAVVFGRRTADTVAVQLSRRPS
ncbi:MAG TPA: hypothetical protein VD929_09625 [Caulobacteraceae bacterium]|nr:hypothetical protein [Caulobacteraceae bacterium]